MNIKSLAKIGLGTKRKKRDINLMDVADEFRVQYEIYNSLSKVAELVKLSPEMVRQFLKVTTLHNSIKELIRSGQLQSVDACYRISKLKQEDQKALADIAVSQKLSTHDLRLIVKHKIDNPDLDIKQIVAKMLSAKNIRVYVLNLRIEPSIFADFRGTAANKKLGKIIKVIFHDSVPKGSIVSLTTSGSLVIVKVRKEAVPILRKKAKSLGIDLADLASGLLRTHLERKSR